MADADFSGGWERVSPDLESGIGSVSVLKVLIRVGDISKFCG